MTFLDDPFTGRSNILIFQLQGSLFFGNVSKVQDQLFDFLAKRRVADSIVIFDCTLVISLDSSACIFFDKIQSTLKNDHDVAAIVFVASPPKLELKKAAGWLASPASGSIRSGRFRRHRANSIMSHVNEINPALAFTERNGDYKYRHSNRRRSSLTMRGSLTQNSHQENTICGTSFDSLDKALASSEDKLMSLANHPTLQMTLSEDSAFLSIDDKTDPDRATILQMLKQYCQLEDLESLGIIVDNMKREFFPKGTVLWNLGDGGICAKLFLKGSVFAYVLDEDDDKRFHSSMTPGSFLGLRSLLLDEQHLVTARCDEDCVFYSLEKETYELLVQQSPEAARVLELSLARYLSRRLRHVSNRIYYARSLPI